MKRKADPNRIVEARVPTRLGDVVREREQRRQGKKVPRREGETPRYHAPLPVAAELDHDPFEEPRSSRRAAVEFEADDTGEHSEGLAHSPRKSKASQKWTPMARAVAMLSRREHSKTELIQKLILKGVDEDEARKVVEELVELDLQSDQRFLESKVRQRVGNGYGPRRAQVELSGHGLDESVVEQAIEQPGQQWIQGAHDLIERRYGPTPVPRELQNKALGLLVRRGFTFEQAQQVIRNPRPEPDEDAGWD